MVFLGLNFSVNTILRLMIEQITKKPSPRFDGTTALQKHLEEVLCRKRFLLVLDDVWYSKDQENLRQLMCPLNAGKAGSKILATSRTSDALLSLGAVTALHAVRCAIPDLDDNVFFKLFMHYALDVVNINEWDKRKFVMIGAEIASKLKRSPLAARIVGGQLCIRPDFNIWRNALDQDLLNDTMGALWWSYQQLNEQIRRCFAYCSIFPRMYELDRDELVNLWVAEGFISTNPGEEMEAVGQSYINELVSTSFLQPVGGGKERYMIHDLLHDLVEKVAGSDCFRVGYGREGEFSPCTRHLFIETCNSAMVTEKIVKLENLRTLIFYTDENDTAIQEKAFEDMFRSLRALRVLCIRLWRTETFSFPVSIGQLKHLRYLSFQRNGQPTRIILPRTFCKLYHMQHLHCATIVFSSCEDIVKLINLRHLSCLGSMDFPNIGRLMSLRTFGSFRVKKEPGYELHQLKYLNMLQGLLGIHGLENVGSREEALEANLSAKERLSHLILGWDSDDGLRTCSAELQADILEGLCPPVYLDTLQLWSYNGSMYPDWVVGARDLLLLECSPLRAIPEQHGFSAHLLQLFIHSCSWHALPYNMKLLTSLQTLEINECMNIRSLPSLPQSLLHFSLSDCDRQFMRSCETVGDPNWEKIQHVCMKKISPRSERTDSLHDSNSSEDDFEELS
ncbi:disease resistance protein RGA2-like [Miscanthus floridulus]|uniref:disease resistance protein RGA2-like n=1 Tax=Miscanthus floridulus TaxID=154761 RepID=UPI00345ABEDD